MASVLPDLDRLVAAVERKDEAPAVAVKLEAAAVLASELRGLGDRLLDHYVQAARAAGQSWDDIGQVLGVSRQGAQQRYGPRAGAEPWPAQFTAEAQAVVERAVDAARALGHRYVGTEHLLLGLLGPEAGLAARALAALGVSGQAVRAQVLDAVGRGDGPTSGTMGVNPRAKRVFAEAVREARRSGHRCPGPEHVLLALYAVRESVAVEILVAGGANEQRVRATLADALAGEAPELAERLRRPSRRRLSRG